MSIYQSILIICLIIGLDSILTMDSNCIAQVKLHNASIEGVPQDATMPIGWFAAEKGTTPDILPGFWQVNTLASDGQTYMGLITREDGSYESVSQRLDKTLKSGKCFEFELDLARSDTYEGYNFPVRVKVWAGNKKYVKQQLLFNSPSIEHLDWQSYKVEFDLENDMNFIIIEAFFAKGILFHYRGNVLLDNISEITPCIRA